MCLSVGGQSDAAGFRQDEACLAHAIVVFVVGFALEGLGDVPQTLADLWSGGELSVLMMFGCHDGESIVRRHDWTVTAVELWSSLALLMRERSVSSASVAEGHQLCETGAKAKNGLSIACTRREPLSVLSGRWLTLRRPTWITHSSACQCHRFECASGFGCASGFCGINNC